MAKSGGLDALEDPDFEKSATVPLGTSGMSLVPVYQLPVPPVTGYQLPVTGRLVTSPADSL